MDSTVVAGVDSRRSFRGIPRGNLRSSRLLLEVLPGLPRLSTWSGGDAMPAPTASSVGSAPHLEVTSALVFEVTSSRAPYRSAWWGVVAKTPRRGIRELRGAEFAG